MRREAWKFKTATEFEPVTSRYLRDAPANWPMKPCALGGGHLWVLMSPSGMNKKLHVWNNSYLELWMWNQVSYDPRSYIMNTIYAIMYIEAWKIQDFNGVWTRNLAIREVRSNQLRSEATDERNRLFVGSIVPVVNESVISNCVERPEKFRASTRFKH